MPKLEMAKSIIQNEIKVIEEGLINNTRYRKWSGKEHFVEMWVLYDQSSVTPISWAGNTYYADITVPFPEGIFYESPLKVFATASNDQWYIGGTKNKTNSSVDVRVARPSNNAASLSLNLYLFGRWAPEL